MWHPLANKAMSSASKPPLLQSFRPDFCSPGFLNGLLRIQHLHWLELRRRPSLGPGGDGAVFSFLFVIPANQLNLACVLATELPRLESEIGCRLRQVPVPEFVAPDGLKAFKVDYAGGPAAHVKFLAALKSICVRLLLTRICTNPSVEDGYGSCSACIKVRTHTKTVRGTSTVRLRLPQLTLDLTRNRTRRPASAEMTSNRRDHKAGDNSRPPSPVQSGTVAAAAIESMVEAAVHLLSNRLLLTETTTDECALAEAAASKVLRVCTGNGCRQRPEWHQLYCLDLHVASVVADAIAIRERLCDQVLDVFADWATELSDRLLFGCQRLVADAVTAAAITASCVADRLADLITSGVTVHVATEMANSERMVVRVSLPCDWRTRRSLLALRPVLRRCPDCGARVLAEAAGPSGFRLTINSRGRQCTRHVSLLQLADCARSTRDAGLGGLLLQDVAALPAWVE